MLTTFTQSTECVWDFQIHVLWNTNQPALLHIYSKHYRLEQDPEFGFLCKDENDSDCLNLSQRRKCLHW